MDYILQMEKLLKYLEFNLEFDEKIILAKIKKEFKNDLNLFGCFIKDYLTIQNLGDVCSDDDLYCVFVKCFENKTEDNFSTLTTMLEYAKYFIQISFEEYKSFEIFNSGQLITTLTSINCCYMIEFYPFIMKLILDYYNQKIDRNNFTLVLKYIEDLVFDKFENPKKYDNLNLFMLEDFESERLVG